MMQETQTFMSQVLKLLQCSRRKNEPEPASPTIEYIESALKKGTDCDSDDNSMTTEAGEASCSEFSDKSDRSEESAEDSEQYSKVQPISLCSALTPPGMVFPPGFTPPPGLEAERQDISVFPEMRRSSLNSNAASFIPACAKQSAHPAKSQQLRQSISMLKGALMEWESSLPAEDIPTESPPEMLVNMDERSSLISALAKLTPQEAATVRSLLDGKLESTGSVAGKKTVEPLQRHTQKPFTPFGASARRDHSKLQKPAQTSSNIVLDGSEESLSTQLRDLSDIDNNRVVMVRKINRLGLESASPLKSHFSQFGSVERVMAAPARAKAQFGQAKTRLRPATMGFVVMSTAEQANAAFKFGAEHMLDGCTIVVSPFQSHSITTKL